VGDGLCEVPARVLAGRLRRREVSAADALERAGILPGFQPPPGY
jgi:hypothetical protein